MNEQAKTAIEVVRDATGRLMALRGESGFGGPAARNELAICLDAIADALRAVPDSERDAVMQTITRLAAVDLAKWVPK